MSGDDRFPMFNQMVQETHINEQGHWTEIEAYILALEDMVRELADDLHAEVSARYGGIPPHPAVVFKFNRDMDPVRRARELLEGGENE